MAQAQLQPGAQSRCLSPSSDTSRSRSICWFSPGSALSPARDARRAHSSAGGHRSAVRGYLLVKRRTQIPPSLDEPADARRMSPFTPPTTRCSPASFLTATVHLVLFGMVVRLFSLQRDRDHYMLAVLAFLMVLAAAVLTVDSVFLFAFAGFMLMAVGTFVLMEMRRSSQHRHHSRARAHEREAYRQMASSWRDLRPLWCCSFWLGAAAIFFMLPRMSAGYLGSFATTERSRPSASATACNWDGSVRSSNRARSSCTCSRWRHPWRLRSEVARDCARHLRWEGLVESAPNSPPFPTLAEAALRSGPLALTFAALGCVPFTTASDGTNRNEYIFSRGTATLFDRNLSFGREDRANSVYDLDPDHPVTLYEADSDLALPDPAALRRASEATPPEIKLEYLQLPQLDLRIPQLARVVTAGAENDYDRAVALERYLTSQFGYTLQLPRLPSKDPLADFLFVRRQGHCEYFASSMAVMLRTLQIPSRVVNGFRTSEFNDLTSNYVIRASSAHSWVEAYFPGYGWVTFDPTPAGGGLTRNTGWDRIMLYVDAAASFWREWVVNYDASHQRSLGEDALRGSRSILDGMRQWSLRHYDDWIRQARRAQQSISKTPRRWTAIGILLGALLLLALNARGFLRWFHDLKLKAHPEDAPTLAAALWYQRTIRWLGKRGWRKTATQTPEEFLLRIEDPAMRERVERFTRAYEAARFGASPEDARRLPELYEQITTTKQG